MNDLINPLVLVLVAAVVTFVLRAAPFIIFGKDGKMPPAVKKVADLLPAAIMGVLVIYCVKADIISLINSNGIVSPIASLVALLAVTIVHLWKRQTLLSIATGTIVYMVLIRVLPLIV